MWGATIAVHVVCGGLLLQYVYCVGATIVVHVLCGGLLLQYVYCVGAAIAVHVFWGGATIALLLLCRDYYCTV